MAVLLRITGWLRAVLSSLAPLNTRLCALGLMFASVHVAADPVTRAGRTVFDIVDSGLDLLSALLIRAWASLASWNASEVEHATAWTAGFIDIPEKLAAVHVLGVLTECALLWAFLTPAFSARPVAISVPVSWRAFQTSWRRLTEVATRWLLLERMVTTLLVMAGSCRVAGVLRQSAVAAVARLGASDSLLEPVGWTAWAGACTLVVVWGALPVVLVPLERHGRVGRWRKFLVATCAALLLCHALEVLW
jgi:hypothetical protein